MYFPLFFAFSASISFERYRRRRRRRRRRPPPPPLPPPFHHHHQHAISFITFLGRSLKRTQGHTSD